MTTIGSIGSSVGSAHLEVLKRAEHALLPMGPIVVILSALRSVQSGPRRAGTEHTGHSGRRARRCVQSIVYKNFSRRNQPVLSQH